MSEFKVGDQVWVYDENTCSYTTPTAEEKRVGDNFRSPIYRSHFVKRYIVGETRISWLVWVKPELTKWAKPIRYSKKGFLPLLYTAKGVDDACWLNDHKYKIVDSFRDVRDADLLKKIAAMIGYDETLRRIP